MDNETCKHPSTQRKENDTSSYCTKCGEKVFQLEENKCKDCKNHKRYFDFSSCQKIGMNVTPDMNVTYKVSEGTCFEKREVIVGEVIIADIIGEGFYEILSVGETYVQVKLLKLFGQGWKWRGHITSCHNSPHPIDLNRWSNYKRVKLKWKI